MDEKGLGRRLQVARQAAGLTQQALCQKANLSYSTLAKIERGAIKAPSIFTIESIAGAVGTTLDELIGRQPASSGTAKQRQHSKSGVNFVYFDVNGCLVRSYHRAFGRLAHDSGQPADVVETVFWHYNDQVCRGELSMADFNAELAKQLHMSSVDWANYYLAEVEPMPHMDEVVRWAAEHYGVGLMTNVMPGFLTAMRRKDIIPNIHYDAIVDSSEVHIIKPESKIYEIAIKQSGSQPNEILFVDDSRSNVVAAEKFGLHVMWFDETRPEESAARVRQALEPAAIETSEPVAAAASEESRVSQFPAPQSAGTPAQW